MIVGIAKHDQAIMATLDDVMRLMRDNETGKAGHDRYASNLKKGAHILMHSVPNKSILAPPCQFGIGITKNVE